MGHSSQRSLVAWRLLAPLSFMQPVLSPIWRMVLISSGGEADVGHFSEVLDLVLNAAGTFSGFLDEGGDDAIDRALAEVPDAGEFEEGKVVFLRDAGIFFDLFHAVADPAFRAVGAVVAGFENVVGAAKVIVEDAAVIDDAGEDFDTFFLAGGEEEVGWPWLQGIEDEHGPVDDISEFLEEIQQAQGEAVGGAGSHAELFGEAGFLGACHGFPDFLRGVAVDVRVVQHEEIEVVGAAALEGGFGGALDEFVVAVFGAQLGIGEARVALGAFAFAIVEVVADHADEGVVFAGDSFEGFSGAIPSALPFP